MMGGSMFVRSQAPARAGSRLVLGLVMLFACADDDPTTGAERLLTRCLETSPEAPESYVLGASWTIPCGDGSCEETLRIESICVSYQRIDGDGELVQLNHGILSATGVAAGRTEASDLLDVDLRPDVDRCGEGPCDAGILVLQRAGEASVHTYLGRPEVALEGTLAHVEALRGALRLCDASDLVSIDGGCEP